MTEQYKQQETASERRERLKQEARDRRIKRLTLGVVGGVLGGTLIIVAAAGALSSEKTNIPDQVEAFKTFQIGPNTHLRSSHGVVDDQGETNQYASLDETITLKAKRFVTEDQVDGNGEWYKVPMSNIKAEDPDFVLRTESGIPVANADKKDIYVNEHGVVAEKDPSSTETTPTN
jgi:hypothetical protein